MEKIAASISETCVATSLGRTKIFALIKAGELKTIKVGRRTLVSIDSVKALLAGTQE